MLRTRMIQSTFAILSLTSICATQVDAFQSQITDSAPDLDRTCSIRWGYIDRTGSFAILPRFSTATTFSDCIAWTKSTKNQRGVDAINVNGKVLFSTDYGGGWTFHNGIANLGPDTFMIKTGDIFQPSKIPLINVIYSAHKFIGAALDTLFSEIVSGGRVKSSSRLNVFEQNSRYGELKSDWLGQDVFVSHAVGCSAVPDSYPRRFSDGLMNVKYFRARDAMGHEGYIDEGGNIRIKLPPAVVRAGNFYEGVAPIVVKSAEGKQLERTFRLGFIDTTGKMLFDPILPQTDDTHQLENIRFIDGIALVHSQIGDCFIDKRGNMIAKFPNNLSGEFHNGRAPAAVIYDQEGKSIKRNDKRHGYQDITEYKDEVEKLLQGALSDQHFPSTVNFTLIPDRIQGYMMTPDQQLVPKDLGDVVSTVSYANHADAGVEGIIRDRVRKLKLPMRSIVLKGIALSFRLDDGQIKSTGFVLQHVDY